MADDLTGACDSAVAFAARGAWAEVVLEGQPEDCGAVYVAVCTGTRDAEPARAAEVVAEAMRRARAFTGVFKKVDSVFRGNTFAEIAAVVRGAEGRLVVVAPAYPELGRKCRGGVLTIDGCEGAERLDVRAGLGAVGLELPWVEALPADDAAVFWEGDLGALVEAADRAGRPVVWVGSGGLAHALAESRLGRELSRPVLPEGEVVLFTGSDHPVSQRQLRALRGGSNVVRVERFKTPAEDLRRSAGEAAVLVMNGGDTALHVCRALGVRSIRLLGEFAPGVPVGLLVGGMGAGKTVVLKSGGFGEEDLLVRVAGACREKEMQR